MKVSPKDKALYHNAEVTSVTKGAYGQWIVTVLLDEVQYETIQYHGYTKKQAVALAKAEYGIE